jgi:hypothetical protein
VIRSRHSEALQPPQRACTVSYPLASAASGTSRPRSRWPAKSCVRAVNILAAVPCPSYQGASASVVGRRRPAVRGQQGALRSNRALHCVDGRRALSSTGYPGTVAAVAPLYEGESLSPALHPRGRGERISASGKPNGAGTLPADLMCRHSRAPRAWGSASRGPFVTSGSDGRSAFLSCLKRETRATLAAALSQPRWWQRRVASTLCEWEHKVKRRGVWDNCYENDRAGAVGSVVGCSALGGAGRVGIASRSPLAGNVRGHETTRPRQDCAKQWRAPKLLRAKPPSAAEGGGGEASRRSGSVAEIPCPESSRCRRRGPSSPARGAGRRSRGFTRSEREKKAVNRCRSARSTRQADWRQRRDDGGRRPTLPGLSLSEPA